MIAGVAASQIDQPYRARLQVYGRQHRYEDIGRMTLAGVSDAPTIMEFDSLCRRSSVEWVGYTFHMNSSGACPPELAIRTTNLSMRFRRVDALTDLNLQVPSGSVYALVGTNGAGKTTTIRLLMNLLRSTSGRSEVLGCSSRELSPAYLQQIGYVSESQQLPGWMTVHRYLSYLSNLYPTWDWELCNDLTGQFSLPLKRPLKHLSHGMRMKAALAAGLAFRPRLIVLDEPFTGLDAATRDDLLEGMPLRETDSTVFISSHDLPEVETVATHIGFLNEGRLDFSEDVTTLRSRFRMISASSPHHMTAPPKDLPESWVNFRCDGCTFSFVESHYDPCRTRKALADVIPSASDVQVSEMTLRSIFVTLVRSSRAAAERQC